MSRNSLRAPCCLCRRLLRLGVSIRLWFLLLLSVGAIGCQVLTDRLVRPARRGLNEQVREQLEHPEKDGVVRRAFNVPREEGISLAALHVTRAAAPLEAPARVAPFLAALPDSQRHAAPGSRGTVLMLHGFQNRKEQFLPLATRLAWAGFDCVMHDSRAHGESGGEYATFGVREAADCKAVLAALPAQTGRPTGPVFLLGYSMGGAVALTALDTLPDVRAVVTLAAFDRLDRVMWDQAVSRLRWLTRPALYAVGASTRIRTGMDPKKVRPCDCAARHRMPLLVIHGADDTFIHPQASEVLEKSARGPCRRILVPGKNHWSLFYDDQPELHAQIASFLITAKR